MKYKPFVPGAYITQHLTGITVHFLNALHTLYCTFDTFKSAVNV